jgi:hypothetical protein
VTVNLILCKNLPEMVSGEISYIYRNIYFIRLACPLPTGPPLSASPERGFILLPEEYCNLEQISEKVSIRFIQSFAVEIEHIIYSWIYKASPIEIQSKCLAVVRTGRTCVTKEQISCHRRTVSESYMQMDDVFSCC